ncbi:uncharacterized protein LOC126213399 isoform X11 [Schistocerca nitens]|uniref:uncharacterized protein LOC126213399 isoform X11 n=1 Tax=Schistocerca nitens TaxID=7011 RepID=UPI002118054C|nr:uncharacterized protein LOC126213399 isoform X11 [Schistocerca nitens]
MDQDPTMWIKKEETDEVKIELHSMFLEDRLKTEGPSVSVKQDSEVKQHADGSEHNSVKDPFGISWSTDFIKEDPELNLEIVTEDIVETSTRYTHDSARSVSSRSHMGHYWTSTSVSHTTALTNPVLTNQVQQAPNSILQIDIQQLYNTMHARLLASIQHSGDLTPACVS